MFSHCKKRLAIFPSPPGMSVAKLSWAGMIKLFPPRESLATDITSGDGKTANFFLQCILLPFHLESREGKPLLLVKAEANGDSRSTSERGTFLGWFVGLFVPIQEPALSAFDLVQFFFLAVHYFTSFFPIAQQAGQTVVPRRQSLNMCL